MIRRAKRQDIVPKTLLNVSLLSFIPHWDKCTGSFILVCVIKLGFVKSSFQLCIKRMHLFMLNSTCYFSTEETNPETKSKLKASGYTKHIFLPAVQLRKLGMTS